MSSTEIRLDNLRKQFDDIVAVRDISITFPSSSVTCLLGPSGCGKTTLMRMIAGLEMPTHGEIYFGDDQVTDKSPRDRNIGMVFQYPVVYQGMSARRNIELPLQRDRSLSKQEVQRRTDEVLHSLDLEAVADVDVSRLNNGARQKVAVAREVARRPRIILFDEPITNVDISAKVQLKRALKRLVNQHNQTIVYVTHDQTEAMTLADEIALMDAGEIVQRGTPRELYDNPSSRFGGWFLGNPGMNFIECEVVSQGEKRLITHPVFPRPLTVAGLPDVSRVLIGIRPERVRIHSAATPNTVTGNVMRSAMTVGGQHLFTIQMETETIRVKVPNYKYVPPGSDVYTECPLESVSVFDIDSEELLDVSLAYADVEAGQALR